MYDTEALKDLLPSLRDYARFEIFTVERSEEVPHGDGTVRVHFSTIGNDRKLDWCVENTVMDECPNEIFCVLEGWANRDSVQGVVSGTRYRLGAADCIGICPESD
ncbi:MAG TPA: hypothetical protein VI756_24410 [Blastocatellia bacterium]